MSDPLDQSLARLHRWRCMQRGLDGVLPVATVAFCVAATVVMLVRLGLPALAWTVWPLAVAGGLLPLLALPRALRVRDRAADLAGHLDLQLEAHGMAMALAALPDATRDRGWQARLRLPLETWQPPKLRWTNGWATLAATAIFALALMVPQAQPRVPSVSATAGLFAQAGARLADLRAAQLLPPDQAEAVQQRLEELKANAARTGMDQATWEGLARLEQELNSAGEQAGQRLAEALAEAERVAKPPDTTPSPDAAMIMVQQLAELAAQAPGLVPTLPPGANAEALKAALRQAAAQGKLSAEQLAAMERLGLQPAGPAGAGLTDEQARALAQKLVDELAKRAELLGDGNSFQLRLGECRGGPDRGPGHTDHPQLASERFPVGEVEGLAPGAQIGRAHV